MAGTIRNQYFGKYRGTVSDVQDPLQLGRLRARVPDVTGDEEAETGWALPCLPFAGSSAGFFGLPPIGSSVWIEFEQGDPDYPIWTGCWWGSLSEVPFAIQESPDKKVLIQTAGGLSVILDDTSGVGGITLETADGQRIVVNSTAIEIDNGQGAKIVLSGSSVSVNERTL
jgi:uncharacterized protein involved in type VI secretion and phage assembly